MVDDGLPYNGWRQFPHSVAGGGISTAGGHARLGA